MVSKKGARIQARCIIIPIAWIDARFLTAQVDNSGNSSGLSGGKDRYSSSPEGNNDQ
jgi:hypothetical protein